MFSPNCVIVLIAPDIAIKSSIVRAKLTGKLRDNIFAYLRHHDASFTKITQESGRFFVSTKSPDSVISALSKCFGVHILYVAQKVQAKSIEEICLAAKDLVGDNLSETFAVRARSFTKNISYKKVEIELGGVVLDLKPELKVNLTKPKSELFCLVYEEFVYFYFKEIKGPQGMPVGSQGKVALVLNTKRADELAMHLLKLGCSINVVGKISKTIEEFSITAPIKFISKSELIDDIKKHKFDAVFSDAVSFEESEILSKEIGIKVFCPFAF